MMPPKIWDVEKWGSHGLAPRAPSHCKVEADPTNIRPPTGLESNPGPVCTSSALKWRWLWSWLWDFQWNTILFCLNAFQLYLEADGKVLWLERRDLGLSSLWDNFIILLLESSERNHFFVWWWLRIQESLIQKHLLRKSLILNVDAHSWKDVVGMVS